MSTWIAVIIAVTTSTASLFLGLATNWTLNVEIPATRERRPIPARPWYVRAGKRIGHALDKVADMAHRKDAK